MSKRLRIHDLINLMFVCEVSFVTIFFGSPSKAAKATILSSCQIHHRDKRASWVEYKKVIYTAWTVKETLKRDC